MKTVRLFISAIVPRDGASQYFAPFRRDAEKGAPDRRDVAAEERNGHEQPVAFTVRQDISTCLSSNSAATRDSTQHPHATCCNLRTYDCSKIFASNELSRAFTFESRAASLLKNYETELYARDSRETRPTHFDRSSAEGSMTTDVQSEQHREKERERGEESHGATVEERERERERTNNQNTRVIIDANIYPTDKEQIDIREPGLLYSLSSVDVQYITPVRVG
ncbi:hypothetical protein ALC53_11073 [Atta colombica]|uniref:Uncharacterized protein n=1 Tax=Atta colombica TaxID=520822 RepID=A0A195B1P8_9HYME|nr:hypothetical protein ALC53_11073 [Atta colombica]